MRCLKSTLPVLLLAAIFTLSSIQAFAAQPLQLQDQASQALVKLDIMHKDKKGSLRLKVIAKRYEFITLVNSAMSYNVKEDADMADVEFKDLPKKHIAYLEIKAAAANGIITAYEDGTIRPDKSISTGDAIVILLRALGYEDTVKETSKDEIIKLALELGITGTDAMKYETPLKRGDAAILIYNFMTVDFAASDEEG